jgi:hypothetical protein
MRILLRGSETLRFVPERERGGTEYRVDEVVGFFQGGGEVLREGNVEIL